MDSEQKVARRKEDFVGKKGKGRKGGSATKEGKASDEGTSAGGRKLKSTQKGTNRFKKPYFGSEKEGQGFADLRKKKAAREYLKFLQHEQKTNDSTGTGKEKTPLKLYDILSRNDKQGAKGKSFAKAEIIASEKQKKKEEEQEKQQQDKAARESAMSAYKAKKKATFLKLCKKTRKGQPVMKNQMEVLLEKIMKHKGMASKPDDDSKR